jgi:hypothetical protein
MGRITAILTAAALALACGGRSGLPPEPPPVEKGPDGETYHVIDKGAYKAYYDQWGRLARIEHDSNGDGRPDQIAHHEGGKTARLIELDLDFDGGTDRWEYYSETGALEKIGVARKGSVPDRWTYPVEGGKPGRVEYDEDGDGRVDRTEILRDGRLHRLELDVDRDGRPDRWQEWEGGRLVLEALDTDGDGQPDRRLKFGDKGDIVGLEPIPSE